MSYRSKHGITKIRAGIRDALVISRDFDTDPKKHYPVLLYTPNMDNTNTHYHIPLNKDQAAKLHAWLGKWLEKK